MTEHLIVRNVDVAVFLLFSLSFNRKPLFLVEAHHERQTVEKKTNTSFATHRTNSPFLSVSINESLIVKCNWPFGVAFSCRELLKFSLVILQIPVKMIIFPIACTI